MYRVLEPEKPQLLWLVNLVLLQKIQQKELSWRYVFCRNAV